MFGVLLSAIDRKNPRAFRLPERVRDYFEGVKTGPEGEYEDVALAGPKSRYVLCLQDNQDDQQKLT